MRTIALALALLLSGCGYSMCQGGKTVCGGPYAPVPWLP